jgi:hypothetical protein
MRQKINDEVRNKENMMKNSKPTGIKSWPLDDRPREKLLKKGAGALSNSDAKNSG